MILRDNSCDKSEEHICICNIKFRNYDKTNLIAKLIHMLIVLIKVNDRAFCQLNVIIYLLN